jgi:hypothetical protein
MHALRAIPWLVALCAMPTMFALVRADMRRLGLGLTLIAFLLVVDAMHRRTLTRRQGHDGAR